MQIENEFVVQAPVDVVWNHLLDVERIAPCAPGAELTEVVDDHTWKGRVNVKVGPVALSFTGTVVLQERDDQDHAVVLKADGREQRGKGAASAVVRSRLASVDGGTRVSITTDLSISGAVAQYGRGMVLDISQRLTREFAGCLQASLSSGQEAAKPDVRAAGAATPTGTAPERPAAAPRPVRGLRLGVWALWRAVVRFFGRLFGRRGG